MADISYLPSSLLDNLAQTNKAADKVFDYIEDVRTAESAVADYTVEYKSIRHTVRRKQRSMTIIDEKIERLEQNLHSLQVNQEKGKSSQQAQEKLSAMLAESKSERISIEATLPNNWESTQATLKR